MLIPVSVPGGAFLQPDIVRKAAAAQSTAAIFLRITGQTAYHTPGRTWAGWPGHPGSSRTGALGGGPGRAWGCRTPSRICRCSKYRSCIPSWRRGFRGLGACRICAEFAGVAGVAAAAGPASGGGPGPGQAVRRPLLAAHLVEILGVHTARRTGLFIPIKAMAGPAAVLERPPAWQWPVRRQMRGGAGGVHKGRTALQLLDHLLVFLAGLDAGNAEGYDLDAAQLAPLGAQLLVEGLGQLRRCGRAVRNSGCPYR